MKWMYNNRGYVSRNETIEGRRKTILMHRLIINPPDSLEVDHINGDKLDNRRENLRICTHADNVKNRIGLLGNSKFKGVYWVEESKKWRVVIGNNDENIHIGYFTNKIAAANAYNYHVKLLHGEFACLNDVDYMSVEEWLKYKVEFTSKYNGVRWHKRDEIWEAFVKLNGKQKYLGRHHTEIQAAQVYNNYIIKNNLDKPLNIIN